jgi:very-short-patch-repair endonuclease
MDENQASEPTSITKEYRKGGHGMKHDPALARKLYAKPPSRLEAMLRLHLKAAKVPEPETEFRFHPTRRWRFDLAWPDLMLAMEVDGGHWVNGRHTRPQGFANDLEKMNAAVLLGWRVLRFTSDQVKDGTALQTIEAALAGRAIAARSS